MLKIWLKTWMAPAAAVLAVLLLVGSVGTAEAYKQGGGWNGGGKFYGGKMGGPKFYGGTKFYGGPKVYAGPKVYSGANVYGGKIHHGHKFARHHRYRFVGVPLAYYGYSNYAYADNSCYWLRRRALDSGSSYWWNRYYACIEGDYPYAY
jgi:hypothetical protein